ncbi:MAG TPA: carboxypeptidase-like regulatory domain-containing protein [Candidatus Paceibacterota bacterium]|nr:carboxypeptidase-like regulatory domain-containing protein [Candidatus Paceibacterota bacterium]
MKYLSRISPSGHQLSTTTSSRGITLIDTIVGVALMALVFVGVAGAFDLSVHIVTNDKARSGAIALADQRMEYIRSLAYSAVGTVGGIPTGLIPQNESVTFNGIRYTRRTYIEYDDDPKDGLGSSDSNHIIEDYKSVKVQVFWVNKRNTYNVTLVTRVSPATGLESAVPGGTLTILSVNSQGTALPGASITIVNASSSPAVNISTVSDASGTASILGAPAASGYRVTVTAPGDSTAQTYSVTAQNTNPNPGNLTVTNNNTTSATFAIDTLGNKTVNTWTQILTGTSTDPFNDMSLIATSTGVVISGGIVALATGSTTGEVQSTPITPSYLANWGLFSWSDSQPATTSIHYHVYDGTGTNLIPDSFLPGNAAGFTSGSVSLAGVSTSTYPTIRLDAVLSTKNASTTPSITLWSVTDTYGPLPLPNIAFTLTGAKTIGSGPFGTIYKYSQNQSTGASASVTIPGLEWDNYMVAISGTSTGYDIASACNPQPESLSPGATMTSNFYLTAHTTNSLLVDVRAVSSGALLTGASVHLFRTGFSATLPTDACGQAFFPNLTASNSYSIAVSAAGYTTYTSSNNVSVNGTSRLSVVLN